MFPGKKIWILNIYSIHKYRPMVTIVHKTYACCLSGTKQYQIWDEGRKVLLLLTLSEPFPRAPFSKVAAGELSMWLCDFQQGYNTILTRLFVCLFVLIWWSSEGQDDTHGISQSQQGLLPCRISRNQIPSGFGGKNGINGKALRMCLRINYSCVPWQKGWK